jgi:hypothetical protein
MPSTRCSQKGDSVSFSLTPHFSVQIGEVCGPYICKKAAKTPKWLQKEGANSKERPLFVEGVLWLNFGVLIGYARNLGNCNKKSTKTLKR